MLNVALDNVFRHLETAITLPACLLTVLVVHELGHYLAARAQGLGIESVTFGRGRLLWSFRDKAGTRWTVHLWPVRAHVSIRSFDQSDLPVRKKLGVVLAGPLANFLLPFVLFYLFFMTFGQPAIPNILTAVEPAMPAYKAGLRPGDAIIAIDGEKVRTMEDIQAHTHERPKKPLEIVYSRDGVVRAASVKPVWTTYRNRDGVPRAHGRIGVSTAQQPYRLSVIRSINGMPVTGEVAAREALLTHLGERVRIGLLADDDQIYISEIDLSESANRHLGQAGHREAELFYLGEVKDNFYLPLSAAASFREAAERSLTMLGHVVRLPFNLFPVDREWLVPDAVVSEQTSYWIMRLYVFVFFTALCSCFIGFINLLPFPKLDGGEILLLIGAAWKRRPLQRREQATMFVSGLLFFYAAVFGLNMNDWRGYYLFQVQKAAAAVENMENTDGN